MIRVIIGFDRDQLTDQAFFKVFPLPPHRLKKTRALTDKDFFPRRPGQVQ